MRIFNLSWKMKLVAGLATSVFSLCSVYADYPSTIISDAPVGYWRLNVAAPVPGTSISTNLGSLGSAANAAYGGGAGSVFDVSGAISGDPSLGAGFAGSDGQINVPNLSGLNPRANFTIEVWANMTNYAGAAQSPLASRVDSINTGSRGYAFNVTPVTGGARWDFVIGRSVANGTFHTASATDRIPTNAWCHLVGTYDGSTLLLYVNGALVARTLNAVQSEPNLIAPLRFGLAVNNAGVTNAFRGYVDEPAIYRSILSPEKILAHYTNGSGVLPVAVIPSFATQPVGVTTNSGFSVQLSPIVFGSLPMQYQWYKNGNIVPNATNLNLIIANSSTTDNGSYTLAVTNAAGGLVNVTPAVVAINPPAAPVFVIDLPSQAAVYIGGTCKLQVLVDGSACAYQWTSNGVPVIGATNSTLVLSNVAANASGAQYQVNVVNTVGPANSAVCALNVLSLVSNTYPRAVLTTVGNPLGYWRHGDAPVSGLGSAQDYWGGEYWDLHQCHQNLHSGRRWRCDQ